MYVDKECTAILKCFNESVKCSVKKEIKKLENLMKTPT